MTIHLIFAHISFSSVYVVEWQPLGGKELLTRLTICFLCILTIWVLNDPVPGHCILVTLSMHCFARVRSKKFVKCIHIFKNV